MSNAFTRALSTPTPQSEKSEPTQVKNNAGGYVFTVSDKSRLERFLILGTDGGTYYQKEKDITKQNLAFLKDLIAKNEELVWDTIADVSHEGRAYRNSPAVFALAYLFKYGKIKDTPQGRAPKSATALHAIVVRTSTHLWEFEGYAKLLGISGRSIRRARENWYLNKSVDSLAYQAVKYRQRNGWTHADTLRLGHPKGLDKRVGDFILGNDKRTAAQTNADELTPKIITGFKFAQEAQTKSELLSHLREFKGLPWEAVPTQFHKDAEVWKQLFYNGQLKGQALLRNITRLARIRAFNDMVFAADYAAELRNPEMIRKSRLHPIQYLLALTVHENGQIPGDVRKRSSYAASSYARSRDWDTVPVIVDALNAGYYESFKHVEPANKRFFLGVDVSGSMSSAMSSGTDLTCAEGAGAMAMAIARVEPYYMVRGFTSNGGYGRGDTQLTDLGITPNMNLSQVMRNVQKNNFGGTDCALPMIYAQENKIDVDCFVVITDNETWAGRVHPYTALKQYRKQMNKPNAKLVVIGMVATEFSIADPSDPGMLDVVGFDTNVPGIISDFAAGRL